MSAINRDKARFHSKRTAGIARGARNRRMLQGAIQGKAVSQAGARKKGASE